MKQQSKLIEQPGVIKGNVTVTSPQTGPLIALRFREQQGILILEGQHTVTSAGDYRFYVVPGDYLVAVFVDVNRDGVYQQGEHGNYHLAPLMVTVQAGKTVSIAPLTISGEPPAPPTDLKMEIEAVAITQNTGRVVPLDSPLFNRDSYSMGMWRPLDFLDQVGGGLFFLQDYQNDKIPVVFVHGIAGGPNDWKSAIEALDRERFQPWVLFYPSGLRLDMISDYFVDAIGSLRSRHRFEVFGVAAHSMGGLVTRSFIKKFTEQFPESSKDISFVMTVNSPMQGIPSASLGVKLSPVVVSAWRDIVPGSEFLTDLDNWVWPREIPYHLVFSYEKGSSSDGTVSLMSQIPVKLQSEAVRIYGFNNDHVGTLNDEAFLELFNRILEESLRPATESDGS